MHSAVWKERQLIRNDNMESWIESMNNGSGSYKTDKSDNVFAFLDLMKENSGGNYMDSDSTAGFTAFANGDAAMLFSGEFSLLNVSTIDPDLPIGLFAAPVTDDPSDANWMLMLVLHVPLIVIQKIKRHA